MVNAGGPRLVDVAMADGPTCYIPGTHANADLRRHTVTVTAVSSGCDGSAEQRTSGSFIWPAPPTNGLPSPIVGPLPPVVAP